MSLVKQLKTRLIAKIKNELFSTETFSSKEETMRGSIYLSCVDSAKARFNIGEVLIHLEQAHHYLNLKDFRTQPLLV